MEAPEKIYVVDATFPDYVDFDGSPINTKRIDDHDVEYTRTNTFIEKAINFLNYKLGDVVNVRVPGTLISENTTRQDFVDEFIKFMEG